MKLEPLKLTPQQQAILAKAGYTQATAVTFKGGKNGDIGGADVVAQRGGKWTLIDELTWTQVVSVLIPSVAPVPASPKVQAPTLRATLAAANPVAPKRLPDETFESPAPKVARPNTPDGTVPPPVRPRVPRQVRFVERLEAMRKNNCYGTDAELASAARAYQAEIKVYQKTDDEGGKIHVGTFLPEGGRIRRRATLLYDPRGDGHYNSIVKGKEVVEPGDGNCMFHALARAFKSAHEIVRAKVCGWMWDNYDKPLETHGGYTVAHAALEAARVR